MKFEIMESEMLDRKGMNEDARASIRSEMERAFSSHKRVILGLKVSFSGRYTINGFIRVLGPVSVVVECDGEDGPYTETFNVNDVKVVSVFE